MSKELIIHVSQYEDSIALLEDKQLIELSKEKKSLQYSVGDVYLGRVRKIMTGLNAAFVDVGYEKDAFLHYHDLGPQFESYNKFTDLIRKSKNPSFQKFKGKPDIDKDGKITQVLKEGQLVIVQVAKEPIANKGPRLSSEISIAGRNLVLLPFSDKVSVSTKIESVEERKRLKQLVTSIRPNNYGIIVRTAAEGKKVAQLDGELRELIEKWENNINAIRTSKPPQLIIGELSRVSAIVRDGLTGDYSQIILDDEVAYNDVRDYIAEIAPERKKIVKYYNGKTPIFEHFGINKQIKSLFGRVIPFKNGCYLILEHTEALHVIDVNSGNRAELGVDQENNALEVNLAAAKEIARQLMLRDMGGIIIVDFIDMHNAENKLKIYEAMKDAMSRDTTKHNILPLSKFGIMQITRQRVRPEMSVNTFEKCPTCKGTGETQPTILFADELETEISAFTVLPKFRKFTLTVHPFVYAYLTKGFFNSIRQQWQKKYNCKFKITPNFSFTLFQHDFVDVRGEKIDHH